MCGFAGIYSREKKQVRREWIEKMTSSIAHRGPDQEGIKVFDGVAMGHRRLSIIDIAGGSQPMSDFHDKAWIVFNGEIYNFKELRETLEKEGIPFKTKSDTEVLLNLISTRGVGALSLLNGMFGFFYYDQEKDYCLLARDHLGVKPVYFTATNEWISFASEVKALLTLPWVNFEVADSLLEELLTFRFVAGGNTLFKNIYQVEPGEYLEIQNGTIKRGKYWDLSKESRTPDFSLEEGVEELDSRLTKSIDRQLVADVPVGTFLSGGVDSGLVTAISSEKKKGELKTFIVGFDSPEWDERPAALQTSKRYATDHHEFVMQSGHILQDIKKLTFYNDEPISHPNTIPFYHLSKMSREKVKVVLTGEGADEILSGYPRHQVVRIRDGFRNFPSVLTHLLAKFLTGLPNRKIKMIGTGLNFTSDDDSLIFNSQFVSPRVVNKILKKDIPREGSLFRRQYANYFNGSLHQRLTALEVKTYLSSALHRLDRMSMANGLECRVPFLDHTLIEFIYNLPSAYKVRGKTGKLILKKLAEKYLDHNLIYNPKSGFGMPLADWFRDVPELRNFLSELSCGNYYLNKYFEKKEIEKLVKEHLSFQADHSELFWILLCLHSWHEVFM